MQQIIKFFKKLRKTKLSQQRQQILIILGIFALALFFRFYNYENFLYFLSDQGRDAYKIESIVKGDLTLIGPTSGLQGFFLGPLWYYAGVPGYLLSGGNPYGICLWYIFLASLALPLFYLISKKLFPKDFTWQAITFALLALIPASINGSIFIWNPLLALPLMALALYAFFLARNSRFWLVVAFLSLAFTLQAEFAYAVFLVPALFLLTFWIRKKFNFFDYVLAGSSILLTLAPQILFEIKNHFLMTKALLVHLQEEEAIIPLKYLWRDRPRQLFQVTQELLVSKNNAAFILAIILILLMLFAIWRIFKKATYEWRLTALFAVIPYIAYMFWGGNFGNFFAYYLTAHFIFLLPLVSFGIRELKFGKTLPVILVTSILFFSWGFIHDVIVAPNNQAGIKVLETAAEFTLENRLLDEENVATRSATAYTSTVTTFTPNYVTAPYDYIMQWKAKQLGVEAPHTQVRDSDKIVYLIAEPDRQIPEKRFWPWYEEIMKGRVKTRKEKVGVLLLETWVESTFAQENKFSLYQEDIREKMCW